MNEEEVKETIEQTDQTLEQPQSNAESIKEYNFRVMRDRAEAAERRAQELERSLKPQTQEQDDYDVADDSLIEGKVFKKNARDFKNAHMKTSQELAEMKSMMAEMKLRSKFSDFDAIVTRENMEKLERSKPSYFRSIHHNPDMYDKGELAYEAIKSIMPDTRYATEDKKIEANKLKPRSASTAGAQTPDTPLMRVGDYDRRVLTEERKGEIRRMMDNAKKYG